MLYRQSQKNVRLNLNFLRQAGQEGCFDRDSQLGAELLTAEATDAAVVIVGRRPGLVPLMPIDRLGLCGADAYASSAKVTFGRVNHRFGRDQVAQESNVVGGGDLFHRFADHIKILANKRLKRVTQQLDLAFLKSSQPPFLAGQVGGDKCRVEVDHTTDCCVQGDRIGRKEQDMHGAGGTTARSIALHRDDAVHDIQARANIQIEHHQHTRKVERVWQLEMKLTLEQSGDAAELVLDLAGDARQTVGFEFGNADQSIRIQHTVGKGEIFKEG